MKITEITEGIGDEYKLVAIGDYIFSINVTHVLQRSNERNTNWDQVMTTLTKVPKAKAKIKELGAGERFWLFDHTLKQALGIKVRSHAVKLYNVNTVVKNADESKPWADRYPVFDVR